MFRELNGQQPLVRTPSEPVAATVSLFDLVGAAQFIEKLFDLPEDRVDLVLRRNVIPELRDIIFGEAIDVFDSEKMEIPYSASA